MRINLVMISINNQLRHHRRKVVWAMALVALVIVAVVAWFAVVDNDRGHDHGGNTAAVCITIGACLAATGAAVFAARRLRERATFTIFESPMPVWVSAGVHVLASARAGPAPMLQVFRL